VPGVRHTGSHRHLTEKRLAGAPFVILASSNALFRDYIDHDNDERKPFRSIKIADQILENIARVCKRTSETGPERSVVSPIAALLRKSSSREDSVPLSLHK
jgi:hypothetical protein